MRRRLWPPVLPAAIFRQVRLRVTNPKVLGTAVDPGFRVFRDDLEARARNLFTRIGMNEI